MPWGKKVESFLAGIHNKYLLKEISPQNFGLIIGITLGIAISIAVIGIALFFAH